MLFPFGQLERIPLSNPQIGLYFHDLVIGLILAHWIAKKILNKQGLKLKIKGKAILTFWLAAFISFALGSFKRSSEEIFIAGLYLLRWGAYAGLYFVAREFKGLKGLRSLIAKGLVGVGFTAAVLGLLQYVFYPDIRPLTVFDWDPHYYRVVATFLEPGFAGLIYVLGMVLLICQAWSKKIKRKPITHYSLLITYYLAFSLTYSRSSYLAYLIAMAVVAWFKKSWKFFLAVILIFIFTLVVLPRPGGEGVKLERQASILSRFESWKQALITTKEKPLIGVGFNFYRYAARDHGFLNKASWQYSHAGAGVDNSFLFVLSTTGIFGFIFYLLMIFRILRENRENLPVIASTIAVIIHSFFNNSFFYPWVMIWFWLVLTVKEYK